MKIRTKYKSVLQNKAVLAFALAILMIVCSALTIFKWNSNDDIGIELGLMQGKDSMAAFIHPYFWSFFSFLYNITERINWWVVFTLVMIFCSLWIMYYIALKCKSFFYSTIFCTCISIIWYIGALNYLNFTRTACVTVFSGLALVSYAAFMEKRTKYTFPQIICGLIMIFIGLMTRNDVVFMAAPYMGLFIFVFLLREKFRINKEWFLEHKIGIGASALLVLVFATVYGSNTIYTNTHSEYKAYVEYNAVRSAVQDYPELFPKWDEEWRKYRDIGVTEQQMKMLLKYDSEDPDVFTVEKLKEILTIKQKHKDNFGLYDFVKSLIKMRLFCFAFIIAIFLCLLNWRKNFIPIALSLLGTIACLFYIYYSGRFLERVTDSLLIFCIMNSFIFAKGALHENNFSMLKRQKKPVVLFFMMLVLLFVNTTGYFSENFALKQPQTKKQKELTKKLNYMDGLSKKGLVCISSVDVGTFPANIYDFWKPFSSEKYANIIFAGGWAARSPYCIEKQKKLGITNVMKALVYNENVVGDYSKTIYNYLTSQYEEDLSVCSINRHANISTVKYSKPLLEIEESQKDYYKWSRRERAGETDSVRVYGYIKNNQDVDYVYFQVQQKNGDYARSFRLDYDKSNGHFYGVCWNIYRNFKNKDEFESFFVVKSNGKYLRIRKQT